MMFLALSRDRAHRTLKEALKSSYDKWQVWENFLVVSDSRRFVFLDKRVLKKRFKKRFGEMERLGSECALTGQLTTTE